MLVLKIKKRNKYSNWVNENKNLILANGTVSNHQADCPFSMRPGVWIGDLQIMNMSMITHDTECPHWNQVSLNNTELKLILLYFQIYLLYKDVIFFQQQLTSCNFHVHCCKGNIQQENIIAWYMISAHAKTIYNIVVSLISMKNKRKNRADLFGCQVLIGSCSRFRVTIYMFYLDNKEINYSGYSYNENRNAIELSYSEPLWQNYYTANSITLCWLLATIMITVNSILWITSSRNLSLAQQNYLCTLYFLLIQHHHYHHHASLRRQLSSGDEVCMSACTYPHKLWGRSSSHLQSPGWQLCGLMSGWWFVSTEKKMVLPYWDQVSLNNTTLNSS